MNPSLDEPMTALLARATRTPLCLNHCPGAAGRLDNDIHPSGLRCARLRRSNDVRCKEGAAYDPSLDEPMSALLARAARTPLRLNHYLDVPGRLDNDIHPSGVR